MKNEKKNETGWGKVAAWYGETVEKEGSYQKELILPNVLRLLGNIKNKSVLDLACGSGFFARELARLDAKVTAVDISTELIALAKKQESKNIVYHVSPAHKLPFLKDRTIDSVLLILALQNIENVGEVLKESARVLKQDGKVLIVMNHPTFRIPESSNWDFDEEAKIQYRRIDSYLSESKTIVKMNPSDAHSQTTISFHRPLQFYFKALEKAGLTVTRLEEWNSHKKSDPGLRATAEDKARKEIPLFLFLEAQKRI